MAGKTSAAGVAVSAAQSAVEVDRGEGGGGGWVSVSVCLSLGSTLPFQVQGYSPSPVFSSFFSKQSQLMQFAALSSQISVLISRPFMSRL